jgi:hypothetical protein
VARCSPYREVSTRPATPPGAKPAPAWFDVLVRVAVVFGVLIFAPQLVGGIVGLIITLIVAFLVLREAVWH